MKTVDGISDKAWTKLRGFYRSDAEVFEASYIYQDETGHGLRRLAEVLGIDPDAV